jgi:hypothetical protein
MLTFVPIIVFVPSTTCRVTSCVSSPLSPCHVSVSWPPLSPPLAPGPILGRLAWALFHLAKFRQKDANRVVLNKELEVAETAVTVFHDISPLDAPGLGEALYLYADRMLELDKYQEAATYAEESVQYFREACSDSSFLFTSVARDTTSSSNLWR